MQAAKTGQVDMIITKSISRFGRNTLDCLKNIRELKALGVDVFFEKENIHSLHSDGELLLSLISAIAQNESFNQSENVKWGIRRQYERGRVQSIPSGKFLGYKKDEKGNLIIDEAQAAVVRRIYQAFLDGFGTYQIAKVLTNEQVPMAFGGKEWCASHIQKVLANEKYKGDTRFQKTFNADYLTKRRAKNNGELPQYYLQDTHPAIIDRETWALVQLEFARQKQYAKEHFMDKFHRHCENVPLSGKIICSECSRPFHMHNTKRIAGKNIKYWQCPATLPINKICGNSLKLDERVVEQAFVTAWNELVNNCAKLQLVGQYSSNNELLRYRQTKLRELIEQYGHIKTLPYELMLKVLEHIEVETGFLNAIFLSGNIIRVDLPIPAIPHPRWTHMRKQKSPIAQRRMEMGLTQMQLSEMLNLSRGYLNRIENGRTVPSPELAQHLSETLGLIPASGKSLSHP